MSLSIVAPIGFTMDFVLRRVLALGRDHVAGVVLVSLDVGGESSRRRVESTVKSLEAILSPQGVVVEHRILRPGHDLVARARDAIARARSLSPTGDVELYLTGGPRMLVVALLLASLTGEPARVVVEGEAFDAVLQVETVVIQRLQCLDEASKRILAAVMRGATTPKEVVAATGLPRSTVYKKLRDLEEAGLIRREGDFLRPHPDVAIIL